METVSSVLMAAAAVVFVVLLIRILLKPIKGILKFLIHAAFGYVLLLVVSFLGDFIGIQIEMNLLNILIAGFFGIPGVIVMVLAKFLFYVHTENCAPETTVSGARFIFRELTALRYLSRPRSR